MKMYRVICERRLKPQCSCCGYREPEDANHSWEEHIAETTDRKKYAEDAEGRLYDESVDREGRYEYRNIRIQTSEIEWEDP